MLIIKIKKKKAKIYSSSDNEKRDIRLFGTFDIYYKNDKAQISNITLKKAKNNQEITNEEFHDLLKSDEIALLQRHEKFEEYLREHNIKHSINRICSECLDSNKISYLTDKTVYIYNNKALCFNCAEFLVESLAYNNDYKSGSVKRFIKLLKDTRNFSFVNNLILKRINPLTPKYSFYDKIESNESEFAKVSIDDVDIPEVFKVILRRKIDYLLPVQILALNAGLLYNENLLVVSQTASGKTLIGELTGIKNALQKKKFIYLSPLVALANQKYRYFKESYSSLGLNVVIRVGKNKINAEDELKIIEKPVDDADIIVATYEGLDYILRSGRYESLNNLATVVIDEIHMLEDPERGSRLHALINRLMHIYPQVQLIGLSATINNPEELADEFNMKLVLYDKRPVSLERHLVAVENDEEKIKLISQLSKKEFNTISPLGYRGQCIVFTDSRRRTGIIADKLKKMGINAASYHAGLSYKDKVDIELKYDNQEISTVVTTAALAAGVDFPASMVIFDSLRMGKDWLSDNEFHQMMGRAGRPTYHDIGWIYIFYEVGRHFRYLSEEDTAFKLLESGVDDIRIKYTWEDTCELVLADISTLSEVDGKILEDKYYNMKLNHFFGDVIDELIYEKMIEYDKKHDRYSVNAYGRAVSQSFLRLNEAEMIRKNIAMNPIDIAVKLEVLSNVYLSNRFISSFKEYVYHVSSRLFANSIKELINTPYVIKNLPEKERNLLLRLLLDFKADCNDVYCDCLEKNISRHIIERRMDGLSPTEISKEFKGEYDLNIYSGDIYNYLDGVIRHLESIERISRVFGIDSTKDECKRLIKIIEG